MEVEPPGAPRKRPRQEDYDPGEEARRHINFEDAVGVLNREEQGQRRDYYAGDAGLQRAVNDLNPEGAPIDMYNGRAGPWGHLPPGANYRNYQPYRKPAYKKKARKSTYQERTRSSPERSSYYAVIPRKRKAAHSVVSCTSCGQKFYVQA